MSRDIEFALIGCGRVAPKHVDAVVHTRGARLTAVCDIEPARAKRIADPLGIPAFADMDDMIANVPTIDVACVLTPSGFHAQHAIRFARHGKHVVVEKPMALKLDDADDMIRACERAGVRLFVVKQNRYNPPVKRLHDALLAGRFGKLVMGTARVRWSRRQAYYDQDAWRGTWKLDGGVLANQASHYIDLLTWLLGPVNSVAAMTATQLVDIETEDTAAVLLRFANGALGVIEATMATRPIDLEGSLSILGERASVVIGGFAANELVTWNFENPTASDSAAIEESRTRPANVYGFGHRAFVENVVRALRGENAMVVDGIQGRRSLEVISAIYEAVHSKREVELDCRVQRSRRGASS